MRLEKLVEFFEAIYSLELDDEAWLRAVSIATRDVWGRPDPFFSSFYDASKLDEFRPLLVVTEGISDELGAAMYGTVALMTPALVARHYRRFTAGTLRGTSPELEPALVTTEPLGVADGFALVGADPDGIGCCIGITAPALLDVGADDLAIYLRMAFHLTAAFRARRRLRAGAAPAVDATVGAEAVLDRSGRVLHAEGPAKEKAALAGLQDATRRLADVWSRGRDADPRAALERHHPLVHARWTLVEAEEPSGARYVVARENQAEVRGLRDLSDRERQVAALVALGRTTKEAAYSLGISDSTTRVLLGRAVAKLGVKTRQDLIAFVTREALPELAEADALTVDSA
jgi:DNA-binding CsgD family transcriptional regulator